MPSVDIPRMLRSGTTERGGLTCRAIMSHRACLCVQRGAQVSQDSIKPLMVREAADFLRLLRAPFGMKHDAAQQAHWRNNASRLPRLRELKLDASWCGALKPCRDVLDSLAAEPLEQWKKLAEKGDPRVPRAFSTWRRRPGSGRYDGSTHGVRARIGPKGGVSTRLGFSRSPSAPCACGPRSVRCSLP